MNVGELKKILDEFQDKNEIIVIFEACDYHFSENDIIPKPGRVFINADQSPIDWSKVD